MQSVISKPGSNIYIPLSVKNASGQLVNADSTPTVTDTQLNGADAAFAPTVAQAQDDTPANITGQYVITLDGSTLADGDEVFIYVSAVVGGTTTTTTKLVSIIDLASGGPSIE